jgi:hypothetical protein
MGRSMRQFGGIKQAGCDNGLPLEIGADGNGAGRLAARAAAIQRLVSECG